MDTERTLELAREFAEALHAVDGREEGAIERMVARFAPEARLTNAALKLAHEERTGSVGARAFWEQYQSSFREAHTEFFELTSSERAAGLFWTTHGTDATGEPLSYDGVTLLVLDEQGLITLFRGHYDTREMTKRVSG